MSTPWYERLARWLDRHVATMMMSAACRPFAWRWYLLFYTCGWCESRFDVGCGPLSFTIQYFRDPAAASAPVQLWVEWPPNQNKARFRNVRI